MGMALGFAVLVKVEASDERLNSLSF